LRAGKGAAIVASSRRAEVWKLRVIRAADGPLVRARAPAERILADIATTVVGLED